MTLALARKGRSFLTRRQIHMFPVRRGPEVWQCAPLRQTKGVSPFPEIKKLPIAMLVSLLSLTVMAQVTPDTRLPSAPSSLLKDVSSLAAPLTSHESSQQEGPTQSAATEKSDSRLVALLKRGAEDQKRIYTAPLQRHNLKWDALFLAAVGGLIATDKHVTGAVPHDNLSVSRNISDAGLYSTIAATGGLLVWGVIKKNEHARETGILGFESFANTAAVVAVTQLIAGRERPLEGAGQGRFWVNNAVDSSFPSMHSGMTWSLASVLGHEYRNSWVQIVAYSTATTVSMTRVTGLKHFTADVAVSGVFGYLIGEHIFHAHSKFCYGVDKKRAPHQ